MTDDDRGQILKMEDREKMTEGRGNTKAVRVEHYLNFLYMF